MLPQNLSSLAAQIPWASIFVAMVSAILGGGGVLMYKARGEREKLAAETERIEADTQITKAYGNEDGTLIEQITKAAGQAWTRIDALEKDNASLRSTVRTLGLALERANGRQEVIKDVRLIRGKDESSDLRER